MNTAVLVMMRSGREYQLVLNDAQIEELRLHKDIGPKRVFIIGPSSLTESEIPYHKMFPGTVLYRTKAAMPRQPRAKKEVPKICVAPAGPIEFLGAVPLHEPYMHTGHI